MARHVPLIIPTLLAIVASRAIGVESTSRPSPAAEIKLIGRPSPDEENRDGEPDPPFKVCALAALPTTAPTHAALPAGQIYLRNVPGSAQKLQTNIAERLASDDTVILLGGHKYMINDCLGIKAGAGSFDLDLRRPVLYELDDAGFGLKFHIPSVALSGLVLRFRPDPSDLLEPCRFSGRVIVEGVASNIDIHLRFNPIIDVEQGRVVSPGKIEYQLSVGEVQLKPVANDVESCAKDMVVDAINYALLAPAADGDAMSAIARRIVRATDEVLQSENPFRPAIATSQQSIAPATKPVLLPVATGPATQPATQLTMQVTTLPATAPALPAAPATKVAVVELKPQSATPGVTTAPIPGSKGQLGRLVVKFPAPARDTHIQLFRAGESKPLRGAFARFDSSLLPGMYDLTIAHKRVAKIEIQPGQQTTLTCGVLRINADPTARFEILDGDEHTSLYLGYGRAVIGLPAGDYYLKIAQTSAPVTIKAGEVVEF